MTQFLGFVDQSLDELDGSDEIADLPVFLIVGGHGVGRGKDIAQAVAAVQELEGELGELAHHERGTG